MNRQIVPNYYSQTVTGFNVTTTFLEFNSHISLGILTKVLELSSINFKLLSLDNLLET